MSLYVGNDSDVIVETLQLASDFSIIEDAELFVSLCVIGTEDNITGATNAGPIEITSAAHGLSTGDEIVIADVIGNAAANGAWTVTVTGANTFTLDGSAGSGVYEDGGTWYRSLEGAHAIELVYSSARKYYRGVIPGTIAIVAGTQYRRFVTCTNYNLIWETDIVAGKRR